MPVYVFIKQAGTVIDVQYVNEDLVPVILDHIEAHHPDYEVTIVDSVLRMCSE